jgi:hypothetical protein
MSTKTTFKRIALVAVVALGLGTVSTAPSNALVNTPSLTLAASTGTAVPGGTAATVATTVGFLAGAAADAVSTTAILTSAPAGNSAFPTWAASTSATNATQGGATTQTMTTTATAAGAVSHVANLTIGSNAFPLIAGVYVVTVTQGSLSATWTLTVAAAAGATAAASRVYMSSTALNATSNEATAQLLNDGVYTRKPLYTSATATLTLSEADARTALVAHVATEDANADANNVTTLGVPVGTAGSTSWASLGVIVANGTSLATSTIKSAVQQTSDYNPSASYPFNAAGYPVTVSISGPGWVSYAGVIRGKSYTELSTDGQVNYLQRSFGVISDGTTGKSTITVSQGATVLATRTIVSHGALATVTLTPSKNGTVLPIAGNTLGGGNVTNTVGAATITVADAAGNPIAGQAVYLVSSDLTVYNLNYTLAGSTDATGSIVVDMNGGIKEGAFTVTATTNTASTVTTGKSSSPASFRVSDGKPTLVKLTINGSSNAEVSRTGRWTSVVALSNAAGPMPAGCYQVATTPTTPNEDGYLQAIYQGISGDRYGMWWENQVCVEADGLYRNANSGYYLAESSGPAVRITPGSGITGIVFDIATVTVTGDAAVSAASDAAAEATDAANAATDAANAAAEAADAATAAAQDAADAVAALSTQVAEMINALKKQITALTNLVIKIQKKVKA